MIHRFPATRIAAVLMCLAIPFSAFAGNAVGKPSGSGSTIEWPSPGGPHESVELVVSFPNGDTIVKTYNGNRPITLRLSDLGSDLEDGQYTWEISVQPTVSSDVAKKLKSARAANDDAAARKIMREAGLADSISSGTITISGGSFVSSSGTEARPESDTPASAKDVEGTIPAIPTTSRPAGKVAVNDQVIPDDLIVQGSACVGFDCVNNESFGFDTIKLKENSTRIKFEDTSTGSFPSNDWQLTANDPPGGTANRFSIEDITGAKVPVTITAGAATNSIFVDSTGRVGFRTATPVLDLHVQTSNTPAIRLEQTNAGGFTAQTWDVAGNEANFFVRDVTGGSRLPFRIRPGAPTSSIDISASGKVGVGTASPTRALHVITTGATDNTVLEVQNDGAARIRINNASNSEVWNVGHQVPSGTGLVFSDVGDAVSEAILDVSGNLTIAGTLTQGSSRAIKKDITAFDPATALAGVRNLPILTWVYTNDGNAARHLGPMAEDFHAAFGLGVDDKHIAPGDQAGLALAAIQGLSNEVQQKDERIHALEQRLAQLEKALQAQQQ
jgi:hypothetical protein